MPARARSAVAASAASFLALGAFGSVPGSPFQPVLAPGAGPAGPLRWLGEALGFAALRGDAAAALGAALLLAAAAAFAFLLAEVLAGRVALRAVVALALVANVGVLAAPLLLSRDIYSYAAYGRILAVHGADPYVATPATFPDDPAVALVGPRWLDAPSVYGPGWTLLSAALARTLGSVAGLVTAFRAIAAAAVVACVALLPRVVRRVAPGREALAVAAFGCNPVVVVHVVGGGHNDALVGLGVLGALALVASERRAAAAAMLAAAAAVKAPAAIPLVLLLVATAAAAAPGGRWRAVLGPSAAAAAVLAACAAPFVGGDPTFGLARLAGEEGWLAPSRFARRILDLVPSAPLGTLARVAFALALVATIAALAVAAWRRARAGAVGAAETGAIWGFGLLATTLLGPMLLPWYVAWSLPVAWLLPRWSWLAVIGTSVALGVSLVAAEPTRFPAVFGANLLVGHWVATPAIFLSMLVAGDELRDRLRRASSLVGDPRGVTESGRDD